MISSIFGRDDRVIVNAEAAHSYPAHLAVRISAVWSDGFAQFGSGILVGADDVLTAGHVVYSARHGGVAKEITVVPAYETGSGQFGDFTVINVTPFSKNWASTIPKDDLTVLKTDQSIGNLLGWVGSSAADGVKLGSTSLASYGYAADILGGESMVLTQGTPDAQQPGLLLFRDDLDLAGGQSGSGVIDINTPTAPNLAGVVIGNWYGTDGHWENIVRAVDGDVASWLLTATENSHDWGTNPGALANQIGRLYLGVFDRVPDAGGLSYWMGRATADSSLAEIAECFVNSPEFVALHGSIDSMQTGDFVDLLYQTLLHRAADSDGKSYWVERIANGLTKADTVIRFSESAEAINNTTPSLVGIHTDDGFSWLIE